MCTGSRAIADLRQKSGPKVAHLARRDPPRKRTWRADFGRVVLGQHRTTPGALGPATRAAAKQGRAISRAG
jgi:hypothetical protein